MTRPKKPMISRERTAEVALQIIDDEGLDGLSLERIAQTLGVKAPSLYHHFGDKADILAEVALLMYLETPVPRSPPPEAWREWHLEMSVNRYEAILKHHRAAPLLLRFFPRHVVLPVYERSARIMSQAGVPDQMHIVLMDGLEKLTFGSALYSAAATMENIPAFPEFDPTNYPHLASSIEASSLGDGDSFAETIWVFLRGFPDELSGEIPLAPRKANLAAVRRR